MRKNFIIIFFLSACTISPSIQTAVENSTNLGPPFPRLAIWWPDLYEHKIELIARYNLVILGSWQSEFLDPLLRINPNAILLNSVSASEIDFNPIDPNINPFLQTIPPEWFLTQVGAQLRENVDAAQTLLPVTAVTKEGIKLFIPGEAALIDGESVFIENVNAATLTLSVRRGYVRPAAAHAAGTRIAAHISFWPNSWVLNVSTLSAKAIANPEFGSEHWTDYNARLAGQLIADSNWSGIFVDRAGQNQSWLIGNSTARSIDPDQSNQLIRDYSAFDKSWNKGLLSYFEKLRIAIGTDRIILINGGIPKYPNVNGTDLEGFPDETASRNWHLTMFGPQTTSGSYFDWMAITGKPNVTTIETYEDNSHPNPNNTKDYENTCKDPTFTPNYRKMRFGLTSALLNNGYFAYEMNTQGAGSLCLMWFDEFDNSGAGRGYLGYPLGDAKRLTNSLTTSNQIETGNFESSRDISTWQALSNPKNNITLTLDSSYPANGNFSARLDIPQSSFDYWNTTFSYANIVVIKDEEYTLSFYARSTTQQSIEVWAEEDTEPWDNRLYFGEILITKEWKKYELPVPAEVNDSNVRLVFGVGKASGSIWLDEISLQKGNPDIWRRDYENGIVLVNGTLKPTVILLEKTFLKINGSQDRSTNDGNKVNEVTIGPHDGIILLKIK